MGKLKEVYPRKVLPRTDVEKIPNQPHRFRYANEDATSVVIIEGESVLGVYQVTGFNPNTPSSPTVVLKGGIWDRYYEIPWESEACSCFTCQVEREEDIQWGD